MTRFYIREGRDLINLSLVDAHTAKEHGFDRTAAALIAIVAEIVSPGQIIAGKGRSFQAFPVSQSVKSPAS